MQYQGKKSVQIIVAGSADEFEKRINKELRALDSQHAKYELQFNHTLGFCAYIVSERTIEIPESVEDEFALIGETHTCGECPFWEAPSKGNVKFTRCKITAGIHAKHSRCCEQFYNMLLSGEIEIENAEAEE